MDNNKPSGTLPTELISEKTFYTLGGASAAVLLVCWAINYIFVDVPFLTYKAYRLIGFAVSEAFAVIIMFQKKDRSLMKWLFAFLNGLLIFVNASGLNVMTSSYIFNPKDTAENKQLSYAPFHHSKAEATQQAGILPLPRMINWWPDEHLIAQNNRLVKTNTRLESENLELKSFFAHTPDKKLPPTSHADSLEILKSQILNQRRRINELEVSLKNTGSELQQQLGKCIRERTALSDSLNYYRQNLSNCQKLYRRIREEVNMLQKNRGDADAQLNELTNKLETCMNEKASLNENISGLNNRIAELNKLVSEAGRQSAPKATSLTELMKQLCGIESGEIMIKYRTGSDDAKLRQQDFYKRMNWAAFCRSFDNWYRNK